MKVPIVKEYGSWVVAALSFTAGMAIGFMTPPVGIKPETVTALLLSVFGIFFLINSKGAFSSFLKSSHRKTNLVWLLFFSGSGVLLLGPVMFRADSHILLFVPLIGLYIVLLSAGREQNLIAQLTGFSLLTLSAPIAFFAASGTISYRLYGAVLIYYAAGPIKVRFRLRRRTFHRLLMLCYCMFSLYMYRRLALPIVTLLPFLENIASVLWVREERLKTTGGIEFAKAIVFTVMLIIFW